MSLEEQARIIAKHVMDVTMRPDFNEVKEQQGLTIEQMQATKRLGELEADIQERKGEFYTIMKQRFPEDYFASFGNLNPRSVGETTMEEAKLPRIREAVEAAFIKAGIRKLSEHEQTKDWYGHTAFGEPVALVALAAVAECYELSHSAGHSEVRISPASYENYIARAIQSHLENMCTIFNFPPW